MTTNAFSERSDRASPTSDGCVAVFARLSPEAIRVRLQESMLDGKELLNYIDARVEPFSQNQPITRVLRTFRNRQRDLLLKIVGRFWLEEMVHCAKLLGTENIAILMLRSTSARNSSQCDA